MAPGALVSGVVAGVVWLLVTAYVMREWRAREGLAGARALGALPAGAPSARPDPLCQVCGEPIAAADSVPCERCGTPQHRGCWIYARRCATYGCGSTDVKMDGAMSLARSASVFSGRSAFYAFARRSLHLTADCGAPPAEPSDKGASEAQPVRRPPQA